jgi:hypothetical protein
VEQQRRQLMHAKAHWTVPRVACGANWLFNLGYYTDGFPLRTARLNEPLGGRVVQALQMAVCLQYSPELQPSNVGAATSGWSTVE